MNYIYNKAVFETEIQLAKSNANIQEFTNYFSVCNCNNQSEPKSHLFFLKNNFDLSKFHSLYKECDHQYFIVDAFKQNLAKEFKFQSYAMHVNYPLTPNRRVSNDFNFEKIETPKQWDIYLKLRYQIEKPFDLNEIQVSSIIQTMKSRLTKLNGSWYLFKKGDEIIGAIGLFTFHHKAHLIGRLQDVDILPQYQGKQYGVQLLLHTIQLSKKIGHNSLSLCCDVGAWPKSFYEKVGFKTVSTWSIY